MTHANLNLVHGFEFHQHLRCVLSAFPTPHTFLFIFLSSFFLFVHSLPTSSYSIRSILWIWRALDVWDDTLYPTFNDPSKALYSNKKIIMLPSSLPLIICTWVVAHLNPTYILHFNTKNIYICVWGATNYLWIKFVPKISYICVVGNFEVGSPWLTNLASKCKTQICNLNTINEGRDA